MIQVRAATVEDIPEINSIIDYYITNTVTTFSSTPYPAEKLVERYHQCKELDLPFLVATATSSDKTEKVLAYAYVQPYHPYPAALKLPFRPQPSDSAAVELTIYVSNDTQARGVGSRLMDAIIRNLKERKERVSEQEEVTELISILTIDEEDGFGGKRLRGFYGRWGLEDVGVMKEVGYKFGRSLDSLIMHLTLGKI
jgi:L-amino acid N-acyltransferase YncA